MLNKLITLLFIFYSLSAFSQKTSLLTVEIEERDSASIRFLCAYTKVDSTYQRKRVMEIPRNKYSLTIQYKHFLIDDLGNVIDLRLKKYVFEQIANDLYEERRGDSLYFRHVPLQAKSAFYKSNKKNR